MNGTPKRRREPSQRGTLKDVSVAPEQIEERQELLSQPWRLVVWNDPVNLMTYVEYVFASYFGFSEPKAHALMMQVHTEGRAVVAEGGREALEVHLTAMHGFGLWATLERDE